MLSSRSVISISPPSSGSRRLRLGVITRRARSDGRDLSWDPEGLFGRTETGHIARRQMQKMMETNKEFAAKVDEVRILIQRLLHLFPGQDGVPKRGPRSTRSKGFFLNKLSVLSGED